MAKSRTQQAVAFVGSEPTAFGAAKEKLSRTDQLFTLCVLAIVALNVVVEDLLELGDDGVAVQGLQELAVNVDGGFGLFEGAGETDSKIGVLGFPWAVDDAAHDGER